MRLGLGEDQVGAVPDAGVDHDALDAVKRAALAAASVTNLPLGRGGRPVEASRGESAYVVEVGGMHLGVVPECLGTTSRIAREFQERSGADRFQAVGWDTVAAAVNDLAAVGVLPLVVNAYFAVGSARWFEVPGRATSLIQGFRAGCEESSAPFVRPLSSTTSHRRNCGLGACRYVASEHED